MALPSVQVFTQISAYITVISAILTKLAKLPGLIQKFPFLRQAWVSMTLGAIACCSLGFYGGYLNYERQWVMTNQVSGPLYSFPGRQAPKETWSQWMMDPQHTTTTQREQLSITALDQGDFLYDGKVGAMVGFLSAQDPVSHGLQGRTGIAISHYALGRFWRHSTATLTVKASHHTPSLPLRVSFFVNGVPVGDIKPDTNSTEYSFTFPARFLSPDNYIYIEPTFDTTPIGGSQLLYLDSLQIETH